MKLNEKSVRKILTERKEPLHSSITNKELRRCYKLYAETYDEIKKIAEQTFKFVKVKENSESSNDYSLEQMPAFWEKDTFKDAWKIRVSDSNRLSQIRAKEHPKKYLWKNQLQSAIRLFENNKISNKESSQEDISVVHTVKSKL